MNKLSKKENIKELKKELAKFKINNKKNIYTNKKIKIKKSKKNNNKITEQTNEELINPEENNIPYEIINLNINEELINPKENNIPYEIINLNINEELIKFEENNTLDEIFNSTICEEKEKKKPYDKDEFNKILNKGSSRGIFIETTKKLYNDTYKKLMETNLFEDGIHAMTQENIIFILENLKINGKEVKNPGTLKTYINIILLIFKYFKKDIEKLTDFAEKIKQKEHKHYQEQHEKINELLPSYTELLLNYGIISRNAEEQLKTINPIKNFIIKYLINYLFFNFFVRNQDVDIFITNDIEEVNKRITDSKCYENTLYIDENKKQVVYKRYRYKTFKSYGVKTHIIKTQLFYNCCLMLNNSYLLQKYDGLRIAETSLNRTVQSASVKNLGEGNIFKILIERAQKKGKPLKEIHKMFELRGSSIEHLNTHYDLGKENMDAEKDFLDYEHEQNINNV